MNFLSEMKISTVTDHVEELIKFLQPLLPLANFHMVDYFTGEDPLRMFFQENMKEIENVGIEKTIYKIFDNEYSNLPSLKTYVDLCNKYKLANCQNICMSINEFQKNILRCEDNELLNPKMDVFMNSKKSHEVEILSTVCGKVHVISKTSHLVDIGDGKGYLSSFLSLHNKIPVLGIDASKINTEAAVSRVKKLSRVWNTISNEGLSTKCKETSSDFYKQITMFVDDKVNLRELISDVFLESPTQIGLIGLHTCGDLSASSIRLFLGSEDVKSLCNVACCYHFISEKFGKADHFSQYGFPLSNYLKKKNFVIGRAARMIAAQSIERILDRQELPNTTLFFRSLYEVLLNKECPNFTSDEKQVGRFRKECNNFEEYVKKASERLRIELDINNEDILELYGKYKLRRHELNLFYLLRGLLSSSIESLILLDRLLYLLENNCEQSFLVQVFDPVISPRCYALIAIK